MIKKTKYFNFVKKFLKPRASQAIPSLKPTKLCAVRATTSYLKLKITP